MGQHGFNAGKGSGLDPLEVRSHAAPVSFIA
jgi:hypothetical protein